MQGQSEHEGKGPTVEALQKKIRKLESELERRGVPESTTERKGLGLKDDKVNTYCFTHFMFS